MRTRNTIIVLGILLIIIGFMYAIVHASNTTNDMLFGDNWNCGYVNTTAMNLSQIRDCYRD